MPNKLACPLCNGMVSNRKPVAISLNRYRCAFCGAVLAVAAGEVFFRSGISVAVVTPLIALGIWLGYHRFPVLVICGILAALLNFFWNRYPARNRDWVVIRLPETAGKD